jgi:hypothetical protein
VQVRALSLALALLGSFSAAHASRHGVNATEAVGRAWVGYLAEDAEGRAYALRTSTRGSGDYVELLRSEDDGARWSRVARFERIWGGQILPGLDGSLYVTLNRAYLPAGSYVTRSVDGGKTWQPRVQLFGDRGEAVRDLAQGADGRLFAAGSTFRDPGRTRNWAVSSSQDGGKTWEIREELCGPSADEEPCGPSNYNDAHASSVAVDQDGSIVVGGSPGRTSRSWKIRRSRDGGETWHDDEGVECDNGFPRFFKDPGGALYLGGTCGDQHPAYDIVIWSREDEAWSELHRTRIGLLLGGYSRFAKVGDAFFAAGEHRSFGEPTGETTAYTARIGAEFQSVDSWRVGGDHSSGRAILQLRSGTLLVGGNRGEEAVIRRSDDLGLTWKDSAF